MKSEDVEGNVTVIGDDGILRSSTKVDFDNYPRIKYSYAKHILNMGEEQLKKDGDKIVLRNADLGKNDLNYSFQTNYYPSIYLYIFFYSFERFGEGQCELPDYEVK